MSDDWEPNPQGTSQLEASPALKFARGLSAFGAVMGGEQGSTMARAFGIAASALKERQLNHLADVYDTAFLSGEIPKKIYEEPSMLRGALSSLGVMGPNPEGRDLTTNEKTIAMKALAHRVALEEHDRALMAKEQDRVETQAGHMYDRYGSAAAQEYLRRNNLDPSIVPETPSPGTPTWTRMYNAKIAGIRTQLYNNSVAISQGNLDERIAEDLRKQNRELQKKVDDWDKRHSAAMSKVDIQLGKSPIGGQIKSLSIADPSRVKNPYWNIQGDEQALAQFGDVIRQWGNEKLARMKATGFLTQNDVDEVKREMITMIESQHPQKKNVSPPVGMSRKPVITYNPISGEEVLGLAEKAKRQVGGINWNTPNQSLLNPDWGQPDVMGDNLGGMEGPPVDSGEE